MPLDTLDIAKNTLDPPSIIEISVQSTVGTLAMMAWAPDSGGSVNRRFWILAWGYVRC